MTVLIIAAVIGFVMSMAIGANDVANSMATAVGAKAITIKQAVIIAALLEFTGAFFFGKMVTETIRKGIVDPSLIKEPKIMIAGAFAALVAAAIWVFISTFFALPISTTHTIVGGMAGFGIVAVGWQAINWGKMLFIISSWFLSPLLGGILAYLVFRFISWTILHREFPLNAARKVGPFLIGVTVFIVMLMFFSKALHMDINSKPLLWSSLFGLAGIAVSFLILKRVKPRGDEYRAVEGIFRRMQVVTSCYVSLSHGANDVANAIGPLAAIYAVVTTGVVGAQAGIPKYLLGLGGLGIALGVAVLGYRVMQTVGDNITELNNTRGFSIDFSTATTVFLASVFGLPVSSSHTVVGSIVGVGMARGLEAINLDIIKKIALSWLLTVPLAAGTSALLFKLFIGWF